MPTIQAKKSGPCSGCGGQIKFGELIDFTRETGPRHLHCTDLEPQERTNRHPATCADCREQLARGQGLLELVESRQDGKRIWKVTCKDRQLCEERRGIGPLSPRRQGEANGF